MKCTSCGAESTGNFCPSCGASLNSSACASCGAALVPGARFCTKCGKPAGAAGPPVPLSASTGSGNMPWYLGGAALLILAVILALPMLKTDAPEPAGPPVNPPFAGASGGTGTPPPLSDNPRENADRLFNRIMAAREQGDTAQVMQFLPMAVQAYGMAEPLDNDGLYHLATIHSAARDFTRARAVAERILASNPDHLLGLGAAGEAARDAGDSTAARAFFDRFAAVYDKEVGRQLPEYLDHQRIFPQYQAAAKR